MRFWLGLLVGVAALAYPGSAGADGFAPQLVRVIFHNSAAAPGEGFRVDLHWQNAGPEPAPVDYWIFVQFRPEDNLSESDDEGGFSWEFPPARNTSRWQTGFVVKEEGCYFRVPEGVRPGRYRVLVGLVDKDSNTGRVALMNRNRDCGGYRYRVATVNVVEQYGLPAKVLAYRLVWKVREPARASNLDEPRYLTKGRLSVGFDPARPSIRGWKLGAQDLDIGGDPTSEALEAEFVSLADGRTRTTLAVDAQWTFKARIAGETAIYDCRLKWRGAEVARFALRYQLDRMGLKVRLTGAAEAENFHLISVTLPALVSVARSTPGSNLVLPSSGGRLVDLENSGRHRHIQKVSLGDPLPGCAVVCDTAVGVVWVASEDDATVSEVMEAGEKQASVGVRFQHRVRAENRELEFVPNKTSECSVIVQSASNEGPPWLDAAMVMSRFFRSRANPLYTNSLIYKIFLDAPPEHNSTTFAEALELIRRVHAITGGARQIVYLVGWQHEGHDTGYPDTSVVNLRLGGIAGLKDLVREAAALNAIVSYHDNFDDAYTNSPAWNPDIIAVDGVGDLQKGGVWAGGQCYIISPSAYLSSGLAEKRVEQTLSLLPLEKTVHLDVLSAEPGRLDHAAGRASGAQDNAAAKRSIVEMWRKRGIDVTSEALTSSFVGPITHFWHAGKKQEGGPFSAETPIPFVNAVLHGKCSWGGAIDPRYGIPLSLLHGATFSEDWTKDTPDAHIADCYYLLALPWSRLGGLQVEGYSRSGNLQRVSYEGKAVVEADLVAGTYRVTIGGYVVAANQTTTMPLGRSELALYSARGGLIRTPLPPGWEKARMIRAVTLGASGERTALEVSLEDGIVAVQVPAHTPVLVSCSGRASSTSEGSGK